MFKDLKTDPRKIGILCSVCAGLIEEIEYIKHNNQYFVKKHSGKPEICGNSQCVESTVLKIIGEK